MKKSDPYADAQASGDEEEEMEYFRLMGGISDLIPAFYGSDAMAFTPNCKVLWNGRVKGKLTGEWHLDSIGEVCLVAEHLKPCEVCGVTERTHHWRLKDLMVLVEEEP